MIDCRIKHTVAGTDRQTNGYTHNRTYGYPTVRTVMYPVTGTNDGTSVWPALHCNGQTAGQPYGETDKLLRLFPYGQTVEQTDNRMIVHISIRTDVQLSKINKVMIIQILN
jgi:hypothetical protein